MQAEAGGAGVTTQRSFLVDGLKGELRLPPSTKPSPHDDAEAFAEVHGWFIEWIETEARRRKSAGHKSWSMKAAFEAGRHLFPAKFGANIPGVGKVGLNNNLTAPLTDLIVKRAPDLEGFFRQRKH